MMSFAPLACPKSSARVLREKAASDDLSRKVPWPRDRDWRDDGHVELEILALPPEQELRDAVDLVVVRPLGKARSSDRNSAEPGRILGKMHVARLDLRRFGRPFVRACRHRGERRSAAAFPRRRMPEVLKEVHAGARVLNEHAVAGVLLGKRNHLAPQLGIFEPTAENVEQVNVVSIGPPGRADRVVVRSPVCIATSQLCTILVG